MVRIKRGYRSYCFSKLVGQINWNLKPSASSAAGPVKSTKANGDTKFDNYLAEKLKKFVILVVLQVLIDSDC